MIEATLEVYRSKSLLRGERWRWRLEVNGRIVAEGGEGYSDRQAAIEMSQRVVRGRFAADARLVIEGVDRGVLGAAP